MAYKRSLRTLASALVLVILLMVLVAGCGKSTAENPGEKSTAANPAEKTAAQVIKMRWSVPFPAENFMSKIDVKLFEKVKADTKGIVEITPYWGGTLSNPAKWYEEVINGAADVVYGTPGTDGGRLKLTNSAAHFAYGVNDIATMRKIGMELYETTPAIQAEFKEIQPLIWFSLGQQWVHTTKRPIDSIDDFKGLTLRVAEDQSFALVKALGANPSRIPMTEAFTALEKGTIDGIVISADALKGFRIAEVTKYSTPLPFTTFWQPNKYMSIKVWNQLSPESQKVFKDACRAWEDEFIQVLQALQKDGVDLAKQRGNKIMELSKQDNEKIVSVLEQNAQKIVQDNGATEIFNKVRQLVDKNKK